MRNLEHDGMLTCHVYAEVLPRVEYELTPLGRGLTEPVLSLVFCGRKGALVNAQPTISKHDDAFVIGIERPPLMRSDAGASAVRNPRRLLRGATMRLEGS